MELRRGYIRGLKSFAQHVLGIFAQFDEKGLVSDWLRGESSPVDEEEIKIKWMTVSLGTSVASEGNVL